MHVVSSPVSIQTQSLALRLNGNRASYDDTGVCRGLTVCMDEVREIFQSDLERTYDELQLAVNDNA